MEGWKTRRLEDVVEKIVINIPRVAEAHRARRLKFEAQRLEFERQERERRERQERQARKEQRLASLIQDAEQWKRARGLTDYLSAARQMMKGHETDDFVAWVAWVEATAAALDPLLSQDPPWGAVEKDSQILQK